MLLQRRCGTCPSLLSSSPELGLSAPVMWLTVWRRTPARFSGCRMSDGLDVSLYFSTPPHTHTHFPFSAVSLSLSLWLFLFTHRHKAVWATQISAFACTRRISVAQGVTLQFWPWKVHRKWPGRAGGIIVTEERYNRSGSAMTERSPHAECVVLASRCVLFPLTEGQRSQSA